MSSSKEEKTQSEEDKTLLDITDILDIVDPSTITEKILEYQARNAELQREGFANDMTIRLLRAIRDAIRQKQERRETR
jgi:hypothetical protein